MDRGHPPAWGPYQGTNGCWTYDSFGNRTAESYSTSPCPESVTPTASYNSLNQVTWTTVNSAVNGFQYDLAGNVINDNVNAYRYDPEGRLCAVQLPSSSGGKVYQYLYDAAGNRVAKGTLPSLPSSCPAPTSANGFSLETSYEVGLSGEQMSEVNITGSNATWEHTNVFAGGKLLATYNSVGSAVYFPLTDWLGTKRAEVAVPASSSGCLETYQSLPYGNGLTASGNCPDATEHHFTGKERDTESGNDYFPARYYSSSMGRWLSPDWSAKEEPVPYAKLDNPQTLNLYSYMLNNPLSGFDPDGHAGTCGGSDGSTCKVTMTQISQNVNLYDKHGNLSSVVNVTTNMTTISNSITGAVVSANASATATNVSGVALSDSKLATIGSSVGAIQQAGASMALGTNPSQLLTAIANKESTLGLLNSTNPMKLSCSSGNCPTGNRGNNIQGALNDLQTKGRASNFDPAKTYWRYNGVPNLTQRQTNVDNLMKMYNGISQTSWGWSPTVPSAPIPAGLQ